MLSFVKGLRLAVGIILNKKLIKLVLKITGILIYHPIKVIVAAMRLLPVDIPQRLVSLYLIYIVTLI